MSHSTGVVPYLTDVEIGLSRPRSWAFEAGDTRQVEEVQQAVDEALLIAPRSTSRCCFSSYELAFGDDDHDGGR